MNSNWEEKKKSTKKLQKTPQLFLFQYLATLGLSCSMQDLVPWSGIKPSHPQYPRPCPHWEPGVLATGPPGKCLSTTSLDQRAKQAKKREMTISHFQAYRIWSLHSTLQTAATPHRNPPDCVLTEPAGAAFAAGTPPLASERRRTIGCEDAQLTLVAPDHPVTLAAGWEAEELFTIFFPQSRYELLRRYDSNLLLLGGDAVEEVC